MKRLLVICLCSLLLLGGCGDSKTKEKEIAKEAYEAIANGIHQINSGIQRVWKEYQMDSDYGTYKGKFVYGYVMQQSAARDAGNISNYFKDAEEKIKTLPDSYKYYDDLKSLLLEGKKLLSWYQRGNLDNTSEQNSLMDKINELTASLEFEFGY